MLKQITTILFVIIATLSAKAQTANIQTDNLRWNATGFSDLISGVSADAGCQFVTNGNQGMDWIQGNGSYVISFSVTGISGSWPDLVADGSVTIGLSSDKLSGQIEISRSGSGITAILTLNGGTAPIKNSYTISSFEKL